MKTCCDHPAHSRRLIQTPLAELTDQLRRGSRKITGPRQAILEVLRRHQHPLTNKEIHLALGKEECDLATVYRNLRTLEGMRMVARFDFGDGIARYELAGTGEEGHHHHLVCTQCSRVVELTECLPVQMEQEIAERHGFSQVTHRLEFFGICDRCRASRPAIVVQ
jgi:Fur family transcriptional regulator, ferric uptake regulator